MTNRDSTLTIEDVILHLRQQVIDSIARKQDEKLNDIRSMLHAIESLIGDLYPGEFVPFLIPVDLLYEAIQDYFHEETWKSTIPTEEDIRAAFHET